MKLDRTTYEIYVIDYLDGKLNAVEVSELLLFLEQNPDLKEEFEGLNEATLLKEEAAVPFDTSALKKPAYKSEDYETLLVAELEGDLNAKEKEELAKAFVLYPQLKREAVLFTQTRLQPELDVIFRNKSKLKVFSIQPYYKIMVRVAAVLLLVSFAGMYFINTQQKPQTASVQPVREPKPGEFSNNNHGNKPVAGSEALANNSNKPQIINRAGDKRVSLKQQTVETTAELVRNPQQQAGRIEPVYKTGEAIALQEIKTPGAINAVIEKPKTSNGQQPEFMDVRTWVVRKFKKETNLENKEGLLARINRATGADMVIEKDTTTGKVTRFEIAGLGFQIPR